ncbi:GL14672 [Drosophila persimilis]|uniref:GL14672 n=1 Tax=Drosophila persimilis TaxID=7234 RepID=B4GVK3_DROPE|nr:GL14672 [Drosophila persimilis]
MSKSLQNIINDRESFRQRIHEEFEQIKLNRRKAERTKENLKQELLNQETLRWYHFKNKIENQREIARKRYGNIPLDMVCFLKPKDEYERQVERAKEEYASIEYGIEFQPNTLLLSFRAELALEEHRLYMAAADPAPDKYAAISLESPATSQNSEMQREASQDQLFVAGSRADLVKPQASNQHLKKSKKMIAHAVDVSHNIEVFVGRRPGKYRLTCDPFAYEKFVLLRCAVIS